MANEPEPLPDPPSRAGDSDPLDPPAGRVDRREFLAKGLSAGIGVVIVAIPAGAGIATFLSPLGRSGEGGLKVRLAAIRDLPEDGTPRIYQVVAERTDAWTRYPAKAIGSVFLRRLGDGGVLALNSSCPHAGCSVGFRSLEVGFHCPCHDSAFQLNGERGEPCVSPRGMDALEVDGEKLASGEVWVTFLNFKAGVKDKIALA